MDHKLATFLTTQHFEASAVDAHNLAIYEEMLLQSKNIDEGNFTSMSGDDVQLLFDLYDDYFFAGRIRDVLNKTPISFRAAPRMTKVGGKTTHYFRNQPDGSRRTKSYEIAISSTLMFQTFEDVCRPIAVAGVLCGDRLEALQRVMEHELIHLLEILAWDDSQCSQRRFQEIAARFFRHTDHRHHLITQSERAATRFGIRQGDRVRFESEGQVYVGRVNRITRRATVLVEDNAGQRFSDGKRYLKFYVPLPQLKLWD